MGFAPSNLAVAREALRYLGRNRDRFAQSRPRIARRALSAVIQFCAHLPALCDALTGQPARPGTDSLGVAPVAVGAAGTPGRRRPVPLLSPPSPATRMRRAVARTGTGRGPRGRPNRTE